MMKITLNGEPHNLTAASTIAELVSQLNLDPMKIAIERNEEVVPRDKHSACPLNDGDMIEIIQFVGGG